MSSDVIPVQVFVRSRPFSNREKAENAQQCLQFSVNSNQVCCNGKWFTFDNVLDPSTQQDVAYEVTAAGLLEQFFKGFNCTILAYGQTGSGKTFTMGTEETTESMQSYTRGIIPRLVDNIFKLISEQSQPESFKMFVSMLEIYDEKVHDLLTGSKEQLQVREQNGIVFVQGLSKNAVGGLVETMAQLEKGCQLRAKGETAMNATSSRSHAIFTICLEKTTISETETGFNAKLHLVDLAGSERLKKTQAEGDRMKEGIRINEGLLALGNVISALSEQKGKGHIPYRDSKITRLLQDSLGGNSYTVMIACVSPADTNAEETLSTLRYADRAKKIKNKPTVNIDPDKLIIQQLQERVNQLTQELAEYRSGLDPSARTSSVEVAELREKIQQLQTNMKDAESKRADLYMRKAHLTERLMRNEEEREKMKACIHDVLQLISSDTIEDPADKMKKIAELLDTKADMTMEISESAGGMTTINGEGDDEDDEMDETYNSKFITAQEKLSDEMEEITRLIRMKEDALKSSADTEQKILSLSTNHMREMAELQKKMDALQSEKEKLLAEIRKTNTTNKLAEERRRKLMEMEKELLEYKKKMNAMQKLQKSQKDREEEMKKLKNELLELKQMRVRMTKQSREESEKYRQWKAKMDKQVVQLKQKERKREFEMAKEQRTNEQKLAVYRQKCEEAQRLTKRLQLQMGKTHTLREDTSDAASIASAKAFIEGELNIIASSYEAELLCQGLKEQRRVLSSKLTRAKNQLAAFDEPSKKRRATVDGSVNTEKEAEEIQTLEEQIKVLEQELSLCTAELRGLQTGCTSADLESREEKRWTDVFTLKYAKTVLRVLFDQAVNDRKLSIDGEKNVKVLEAQVAELEKKKKEGNAKMYNELEQKKEELRLAEKNNEKLRNEFYAKFGELMMILSANVVPDADVVQRLEELRAYTKDKKSRTSGKINKASRSSKGLARSRSSSSMSAVNADNIQPDRFRSNRRPPERYGDVHDPIKELVAWDEEDSAMLTKDADATYEIQDNSQGEKKTRRMKREISPIRDLTFVESDNANNQYSIPPKNRRDSFVLSRAVNSSSADEIKENEAENANATFVMGTSSPRRTILIAPSQDLSIRSSLSTVLSNDTATRERSSDLGPI